MRLNAIPNYLDQALNSKIGVWVGTGATIMPSVITGAYYLSKSLKTSTLSTTIICSVAEIAAIALMFIMEIIGFEFLKVKRGDSEITKRWKERFIILKNVIPSITLLIIGGAALKYLAPQSSIISNSAFLLGNLTSTAFLAHYSLSFFQGKI